VSADGNDVNAAGYGRVDPTQHAAEERLGRMIAASLMVVAVLALLGLVLENVQWLAWSAVWLALTIPVARVAWLTWRWSKVRDLKYVWATVVLLGLIAVGPIIALVS
jgi:hypothetical protein